MNTNHLKCALNLATLHHQFGLISDAITRYQDTLRIYDERHALNRMNRIRATDSTYMATILNLGSALLQNGQIVQVDPNYIIN